MRRLFAWLFEAVEVPRLGVIGAGLMFASLALQIVFGWVWG